MYEKIYSFRVLDELQAGKKIYFCDRMQKEVHCLNELAVGSLIIILDEIKKDETRYEFWYERESEK